MTRSKNNGKRKRGMELWGGRPLDGHVHNAKNKRLARKIERAEGKKDFRKWGKSETGET